MPHWDDAFSGFTSAGGFKVGPTGGEKLDAITEKSSEGKEAGSLALPQTKTETATGSLVGTQAKTDSVSDSKVSDSATAGSVGLKFEATTAKQVNGNKLTGGFKFETPAASQSAGLNGNPGIGGFKFGGSTTTTTTSSDKPAISDSSKSAIGGFSFGSKGVAETSCKDNNTSAASGGFKFPTEGGFKFGASGEASASGSVKNTSSNGPTLPQATSSGGFKFDAPKSEAAGGFKFDVPKSDTGSKPSDGVTFQVGSEAGGAPSGASGEKKDGGFSIPNTTTGLFSFGSAKPASQSSLKTDTTVTTTTATSSSLFQFGAGGSSTSSSKPLGAGTQPLGAGFGSGAAALSAGAAPQTSGLGVFGQTQAPATNTTNSLTFGMPQNINGKK